MEARKKLPGSYLEADQKLLEITQKLVDEWMRRHLKPSESLWIVAGIDAIAKLPSAVADSM